MRDDRGRYQSAKPITDSVPAWASGCEKCTCGIVAAPELTGAAPLYLERLVQAIDGDIHFCTCQAGKAYRASLLNRHQKLVEEARHDTRMQEAASRKSHPDIEGARVAMHATVGQGGHAPTIHYEAAETKPAPAPTPTPTREPVAA